MEKAGFKALDKCASAEECGQYQFIEYYQGHGVGFLGNARVDSQRYLAAQKQSPTGNTYVTLFAYTQLPEPSHLLLTVIEEAPLA